MQHSLPVRPKQKARHLHGFQLQLRAQLRRVSGPSVGVPGAETPARMPCSLGSTRTLLIDHPADSLTAGRQCMTLRQRSSAGLMR